MTMRNISFQRQVIQGELAMNVRLFHFVASIILVFLASQAGAAYGQSASITVGYPGSTDSIYKGGDRTMSGYITCSTGTPNKMQVVIKASDGAEYSGEGTCTPLSGVPNTWSWTVKVNIPATAATGTATCTVRGSKDGGSHWDTGVTTTNPTIY
jgi:hypothetical protein